jgi:hypothetical protein
LRVIFGRLLFRPPTGLQAIMEEVNAVLQRSEEARIYHWVNTHGEFPPSRREPDS